MYANGGYITSVTSFIQDIFIQFFVLIETCMEPGLMSGGGCALLCSRVMNLCGKRLCVDRTHLHKCVYTWGICWGETTIKKVKGTSFNVIHMIQWNSSASRILQGMSMILV